jgi:hypothetical protein
MKLCTSSVISIRCVSIPLCLKWRKNYILSVISLFTFFFHFHLSILQRHFHSWNKCIVYKTVGMLQSLYLSPSHTHTHTHARTSWLSIACWTWSITFLKNRILSNLIVIMTNLACHLAICSCPSFRSVCKIVKSKYYHQHVCLSIRWQGTTWFPLNLCSWNFMFEYLSKICWESSNFIKLCQGYFTQRSKYIYNNISASTQWHIWLRYCATSRTVTVSIPNEFVGSNPHYIWWPRRDHARHWPVNTAGTARFNLYQSRRYLRPAFLVWRASHVVHAAWESVCFVQYYTDATKFYFVTSQLGQCLHTLVIKRYVCGLGSCIRHKLLDLILNLGLTYSLTEMSRRGICWWSMWPVHRVDNLTTFMCLNLLQPERPLQTCSGVEFPLPFSLSHWILFRRLDRKRKQTF